METHRAQENKQNNVDSAKDTDEPCRWGPCLRPLVFQRFRDSKCLLFWLSWAAFCQGFVVNGMVNVVISTLERRFGLSSSESGLIPSCYDIMSTLSVLPIAYFGGLGHKARFLATGVLFIGIACIIFSLPHFTTVEYSAGTETQALCASAANASSCQSNEQLSSLSNYKYVFYVCMLMMGVGAAPLLTLGPVFLDTSVSVRYSSLYVGIYYAFFTLGPALGYVVGGVFLNFYVDFDTAEAKSAEIPDSNSSTFVGAWWIGFIINGVLTIFCALMLYGFPNALPGEKRNLNVLTIFCALMLYGFPNALPGSAEYSEERKMEVHKQYKSSGQGEMFKTGASFKQIFLSIKNLFKIPTYVLLTLAETSDGILVAGLSTFTPKFIELQFGIPSSTSALYVGLIGVPTAGGGTFLGGYLVKRYNMRLNGIIKFCTVCIFVSFFSSLYFLIQCDQAAFAGINTAYGASTDSSFTFDGSFRTDACHSSCGCSKEDSFDPVCGKDGITYFSPCYAGCLSLNKNSDPWQYSNCSCVGNGSLTYDAVTDGCPGSCRIKMIGFMIVFALFMVSSFIVAMPALSATLRLIPENERSFALGMQYALSKCLGWIPGPILFGRLIDSTCLLWQRKCGEVGSCYYYNTQTMAYYFLGVTAGVKLITCLFFSIALVLNQKESHSRDGTDTNMDKTINIEAKNSIPEINKAFQGDDSVTCGIPSSEKNDN